MIILIAILAIITGVSASLIDMSIEIGGIKARTDVLQWLITWIGVSVVVHLSLILSPAFRLVYGGRRVVWYLITLPLLFSYSIPATIIGQSAYIKQQSAQVDAIDKTNAARERAVEAALNAAEIQQRYAYATRSQNSIAQATTQLDKLAEQAKNTHVSNADSVSLLVRLLKTTLPSQYDQYVTSDNVLLAFNVIMSLTLLFVSICLSDLGFSLIWNKSKFVQNVPGQEQDTKTNNKLGQGGHLTNTQILDAINARVVRVKDKNHPDNNTRVNRAWIDKALRDTYNKSIRGQKLDTYIKSTQRKLDSRWFSKVA